MVESAQGTNSLRKSYKFSDYEVEDWLTQIFNSKSNSEFKTQIEANTLLAQIVDHFKAGYEENYKLENNVNSQENEENKEEEKVIAKQAPVEQTEQQQSELLDELETFIKGLLETQVTDSKSYITTVLFLFSTYIRENSLGPSVYTQYVQETLAPLDTSGALPENPLDPISFKNKALQQALLKHFEKDGEQLFHKSQFLIILYVLDMLLTDMDILEV